MVSYLYRILIDLLFAAILFVHKFFSSGFGTRQVHKLSTLIWFKMVATKKYDIMNNMLGGALKKMICVRKDTPLQKHIIDLFGWCSLTIHN